MRRARGKVVKIKVRYMNNEGRTTTKKINFPIWKKQITSTKSSATARSSTVGNEVIETVDRPIDIPELETPITDNTIPTTTGYNSKKQEEVMAWKHLREMLFEAAVSNDAPASHVCTLCSKEECNIIRCRDCGPSYIVCRDCFRASHSQLVFHVPEIWKDLHFSRLYDEVKKLNGDHECSNCYTRQLTVLDGKSRLHQTLVSFCKKENENVTLLKRGLWGATPIQPSVAYSTDLLDLLTALQLEGHVSTKAFVDSLLYLNQLSESEVKTIYRLLVSDCISEYHFLRHKKRMLPFVEESLKCPACPKHDGDLIVSMDANFGLVRKMNAGKGFQNEKMSMAFFVDESETDEFVETYDDNSSGVVDCSTFKAGDKLRSKMKWAKLAVKGVFGVACRHEVPIHLADMKHGERLAYPVLMLNKLIEKKPEGVRLHVLYDIACTLTSHLKKRNNLSLLEETNLALPIFHAYGHKSSCQVLFNPRRKTGLGLSDGEGMERFWSYLRPFSWITKDMRPDNRRDLLAHASFHYGWKKISHIEITLHQRRKRAMATKQSAEVQLKEVLETFNKTQEDVKLWKQEEEGLLQKQCDSVPKNGRDASLYNMQKKAIEREILLSMKSKYSDGQSIAIKLAKQIKNTTVALKKTLNIHNEKNNEDIQLPEALNSRSNIYNSIMDKLNCDLQIPWTSKKRAIDAMCLSERASEEISLIVREFDNLLSTLYVEHRHQIEFLGNQNVEELNQFDKGRISRAVIYLKEVEDRIRKTVKLAGLTEISDDEEDDYDDIFPDPVDDHDDDDDFYDD